MLQRALTVGGGGGGKSADVACISRSSNWVLCFLITEDSYSYLNGSTNATGTVVDLARDGSSNITFTAKVPCTIYRYDYTSGGATPMTTPTDTQTLSTGGTYTTSAMSDNFTIRAIYAIAN